MLTALPVRAFSDNYIWLVRGPTAPDKVAIVDPGQAGPVVDALADSGLTPAVILITHHHYDHTGGVVELARRYDLPVYGPANPAIDGIGHALREGDRVTLGELGLDFEVLEIPGHTLDHIAYVGHGAVFCGDTLFSAGCGRLFEGSAGQMRASLSKLRDLPPSTQVYCAHEYTLANLLFAQAVEPGNDAIADYLRRANEARDRDEPTLPSQLDREMGVNPFLRWDQASVIAAAQKRSNKTLGPDGVFATIRDWKDRF